MRKLPIVLAAFVLTILNKGQCSFESQPKISFENGCLAIESAWDKNISIRLAGSTTSSLYVNDMDMVNALNEINKHHIPGSVISISAQIDTITTQVFGIDGLEKRVEKLENGTWSSRSFREIRIFRKVFRSFQKVHTLETKLHENNCRQQPCKNGGTCVNLYAQYHCICPKNWQGATCEEDVDECSLFSAVKFGCQNGATCINTLGSYRCVCPSGWVGLHCMDRKADCLTSHPGELCGNGTCVNAKNDQGYDCICNQGWTKASISGVPGAPMPCTADIDECLAQYSPCTSTCINTPGSFRCGPCPTGFTGNGFHCTDINECLIDNGGCSVTPRVLCINTEGSFNCGSCPLGWVGDGKTCAKLGLNECTGHNVCHPLATCQIISGTYVCTCPRGMVGDGFGVNGCRTIQVNPCDPNPCKNGGTCVKNGSSYNCTCRVSLDSLVIYSPARNCEIQADPCASNPCLNGATCVSNLTSSSFTCICPRALTGTFCTVDRRGCGRILRLTTGVLKYPNMDGYDHNDGCAWVIRTVPTKVLNVTFKSFDLEPSINCVFDWLQIHDGRSSAFQLIGRFCGSNLPKGGNIISTQNELYLWFRSDNSTSHKGFELTWSSIDPVCGGVIDAESHGTITSPGYPASSPPNRECKWVLKAPLGKVIHLVFYTLNLGTRNSCDSEFLAIYSGRTTSDVVLAKYCNSTLPGPIRSPSHEMSIYFATDAENHDSMFQIHYSVVGVIGCGGVFTKRTGEFEAPQAANRYVGSFVCEYLIQLKEYSFVKLHFMEFNLKVHVSCEIEAIEVYEGNSQSLVARWCGTDIPPDYNSTSNSIVVKYISTGILTSTFRARYEPGCGGIYRNRTGSIKSPNYPNGYYTNLRCVYTIEAPVGYAIRLVALAFRLYEAGGILAILYRDSCSASLTIYDGFVNEKKQIGKYCGTTIPVTTISELNHLILIFEPGSFGTKQGFHLVYTFIDVNCGGILKENKGVIESPVYRQDEGIKNDFCSWIIKAPEGNSISLSFDRFDLTLSQNCTQSNLQIFDNSSNTNEVIGRYCGNSFPQFLTIYGNFVTLKFHSSHITDGFKISYTFRDERLECGGKYSIPAGFLRSPGSPSEYLPSKDCIWILEAPLGSQIELNVKKFQLEASDECSFDYIEIRNGMTNTSPLIGRFCGQQIPIRIPSFTNHLYVHFHSDYSNNNGGFEIQWDRTSSRCGGLLDSFSGSIQSPHYPELVTNAAQCKWNIVVNKGSTIVIHVKQIGASDDLCLENHLKIYDGSIANYNQLRLNCSIVADSTVETTGNEAVVTFTSHVDDNVGGFFLNYTINCNRELRQREGTIESPNFPNLYPNKISCKWKIIGEGREKIVIDVSHLDMEQLTTNNECRFDYLEIVDIKDNAVMKKQKYCTTKPGILTSLSETVLVNFNTDLYDKGSGFHLEYKIQGCGQTLLKPFAKFESPNYPYSLDINCVWVIRTEIGNSIELTLDVKLNTHDNCTANSLQISTGPNGMYEVSRYCDTTPTHVITVPGHEVYIRFKSDGVRVSKGFKAEYRKVKTKCGGRVEAVSGMLYSPNYPKLYDNDLYCEWILNFHSIKLAFQDMDLELSPNCENDYVASYISNGLNTDVRELQKKTCGSQLGKYNLTLVDKNKLLIVFRTNTAIVKTGFALKYESQCYRDIIVGPDIGIIRKTISQGSCFYSLRNVASTRKTILTVTEANCDTSASLDPNDSYFTIKTSSRRLQFCNHIPTPIITDDSNIDIKLPTGTFAATFTSFENSCGGDFTSLRGNIASPFYPNSYPSNIECVWTVDCRPGNSLQLSFLRMGISSSEHCNEDYLEIREKNATGKLLGLYCSDTVPGSIDTTGSLWMKFRSGEKSTGDGFLVLYSYEFYNDLNGTSGRIQSPPLENNNNVYKWRITVATGSVIELHIVEYIGGLQVFDGFDETAYELSLTSDTTEIKSSTSVLFIIANRNELKSFIFDWVAVSKQPQNETHHSSCGNEILTVSSLTSITLTSPGYPNGYANNLHCHWIVTATEGFHATIVFSEIALEKSINCRADYVEIFSSKDMKNWVPISKLCASTSDPSVIHGNPYLQVIFHSDFTANATGFNANVGASCGSEMTSSRGEIRSKLIKYNLFGGSNCTWNIRVKPGRKIQFNLTVISKEETFQHPFIIIKDGIDEHSPPLGTGKYLFEHANVTIPTTSSNRAFVYFDKFVVSFSTWTLTYKEILEECGDEFVLTSESDYITIMTPNYPDIPQPFTECTWVVRAPVADSINVTFVERFDMTPRSGCEGEYLEMFDGATALAPLIGIFCHNPRIVHSTGSFMRLHFVTAVTDPRNGFKAIVRLTKCGGTYTGYSGEVKSLHYPTLGAYPTNVVCEYRIKLNEAYQVNLTFNDIDLPYFANSSENDYISLIYPAANEELNRIYKTSNISSVVYNVNEILIKFVTYGVNIGHRGFKITFRSVYNRCGSTFTEGSGEIVFPPPLFQSGNRVAVCTWRIIVSKGQRVKLEIVSFTKDRDFFLDFFNDQRFYSRIIRIKENHTEPIYSTNNFMLVKLFPGWGVSFRLKFSPDTASPCSSAHDEDNRLITSLSTESYFCEYEFKLNGNETLTVQVTLDSSSFSLDKCYRKAPILLLMNNWLRVRNFCGNKRNEVVSVPFKNVLIQTRRQAGENVTFTMAYRRHNCGGIIKDFPPGVLIKNPVFEDGYGRVACSWQLIADHGNLNYLFISTKLTADCDKEYLNIYGDYLGKIKLKTICKQNASISHIFRRSILITYEAEQYSSESTFAFEITSSSAACGGNIETFPFEIKFNSADYKNNMECIWDFKAKVGFHLELEFIDRFFVEQSQNCTKDSVELFDVDAPSGRSVSLGRFCGREKPDKVYAVGRQAQIIFRTDNTTVGDGFSLRVKATCGGIFKVTETVRTISSPNYPLSYLPNLQCNYTLVVPEHTWINVKLMVVNLEYSPTCNLDNLTLHQYDANAGVMKQTKAYCRIQSPVVIRSEGNIHLVFKTDRYVEKDGFTLEYHLETCGGTITEPSYIQSPVGTDNKYPNNMDCYWNITAPENKTISIAFKYFDMESSYQCEADFVEIFSDGILEYFGLKRLCGKLSTRLPVMRTKTATATLHAHSDKYNSEAGFAATIDFIDACEFRYNFSGVDTKVISRSGLDGAVDCHYSFEALDGYQIQLEFIKFDLELCDQCNCSGIEIRNGNQHGELLGKYCGNTLPGKLTSTQTQLSLRIVLKAPTNEIVVNVTTFKSLCGAREIILTGNNSYVLKSPEDKGLYPPNTVCYWQLKSESGSLQLHFDQFQLQSSGEDSNDCDDYVEIKDTFQDYSLQNGILAGPASMYETSGMIKHLKFCGNSTPSDYFSVFPSVIVTFKSDSTVQYSGFQITARSTEFCTRNFTNSGGRIVGTHSKCDFLINAPENYTISLYFTSFWGGEEERIKIYDGNTNKRLNVSLPTPIFADTNRIRVVTNTTMYNYYDITYWTTNKGLGCGGEFYGTQGLLSSPLYPSSSRDAVMCRWNIRTAQNSIIVFTFAVFDLGDKVLCTTDFVQLIEYDSQGREKVMRQYCGVDVPAVYRSESNQLSIVYNKSVHFDSTGWTAEFTSHKKPKEI